MGFLGAAFPIARGLGLLIGGAELLVRGAIAIAAVAGVSTDLLRLQRDHLPSLLLVQPAEQQVELMTDRLTTFGFPTSPNHAARFFRRLLRLYIVCRCAAWRFLWAVG